MEKENNLKIIKDEHIKKLFSDPSMQEYVKKFVSLITHISLEELERNFKMVYPDDSIVKQIANGETGLHYLHDDIYINVKINMK